jgi:hypothetical protein
VSGSGSAIQVGKRIADTPSKPVPEAQHMSPPRSTPSRRVDLCIAEALIHTHSSLRPPVEAADSPQTLTMVRLSSTPANVSARRLAAPSLRIVGGLILIGLQVDGAGAAQPTLPAADLIVQIRMVSDAELAADVATSDATESAAKQGLSISNSADESASARTQEIRVRNGESASMSWSQTLPVQWLQAAELRGGSTRAGGGGLVNGLVWLRAGQSLSVQPRWPGGRQPVRLNLRLEIERIGDRRGQEVPSSSLQTSASTLSLPLGQWTTFAATGTAQPPLDPAVWSTQALRTRGRQLMQVRVLPN